MKHPFIGTGAALVTPFREDSTVNYALFDRLIDFQLENETDAVVVCGTTGEGATLTIKERMMLFQRAADRVNGRVPLICGTGSNSTSFCLETAKQVNRQAMAYNETSNIASDDIPAGAYVFWNNGAYVASQNISYGDTLSSSNLSPVVDQYNQPCGFANALNSKLSQYVTLDLANVAVTNTDAGGYYAQVIIQHLPSGAIPYNVISINGYTGGASFTFLHDNTSDPWKLIIHSRNPFTYGTTNRSVRIYYF